MKFIKAFFKGIVLSFTSLFTKISLYAVRIVFSILILCVIFMLYLGLLSKHKSFNRAPLSDSYKITFIDKTLDIPRAYLPGWDGEGASTIWLLLPDLELKSDNNRKEFSLAFNENVLRLGIWIPADPEVTERYTKKIRSLETRLGKYSDGTPYYKDPVDYGYGLVKYEGIERVISETKKSSGEVELIRRKVFYVHRNKKGQIEFIMSCFMWGNPSCRIKNVYLNRIALDVYFSAKNINQAVEINNKFKELFESFIVEGKKHDIPTE